MLFNSIEFIFFLPIVVFIYFLLPHKFRWILLLIASYYFYMCWKASYIILIITSTVIDYFAGLWMYNSNNIKHKRFILFISLFTNLGLLFFFKYYNFFLHSMSPIFQNYNIIKFLPEFKLLLPVGISFYTFQTLSYTIDVYRGKMKPEKHFGIFALYVSFFPQLVAGPIERSTRLLPQFYKVNNFDYNRVKDGLKLIIWGFFKKMVIADRLAIIVNHIYNNADGYSGLPLIIATIFFAFQIYCDFSGYSDIAIGSAQILGYKLMNNFNRPYFSKSISEFWKRWHISLSSWFKDYLYISLGGNRVSIPRWYFNLFITFLISGLWHGANWTFILWGALHGVYLIFGVLLKKTRKRMVKLTGLSNRKTLHKYTQIVITFTLVCFGWIFFRANNIHDAFYIISHLFNNLYSQTTLFVSSLIKGDSHKYFMATYGINNIEFIVAVLSILFMEFIHVIQRHGSIRHMLSQKPFLIRWSIYYILVMSIIIFGVYISGRVQEFIYFQF